MENEVGERFVLAAGTTRTARIDGISAAGADPAAMAETPSADAEVLVYGRTVRTSGVPVSPTGCPTPAVVTRAVREVTPVPVTVLDAGLTTATGAPTVDVDATPGGDVRDPVPVPDASAILRSGRDLGRAIPESNVYVAETIPGGTTTALGVLRALEVSDSVSSSLPENPLARKREVVDAALSDSPLDPPADPIAVLRHVGDPVLTAATGVTLGALETGTDVTLAGGTQLLAVAALIRTLEERDRAVAEDRSPDGRDYGRLDVATTPFVVDDPSADFRRTAATLDLDVTVTDPVFDRLEHVVTNRFRAGEAKEGVGMGGALALADRRGVSMADVRDRIVSVYDRLCGASAETSPLLPDGDAQ